MYLVPDAAFGEVQKAATTQRHPITMNARTLWTRLRERGVLLPGDDRGGKVRHTTRLTVSGGRVDVLRFHRGQFYPAADARNVPDPDPSSPPGSVPNGPIKTQLHDS